MKKFMNMFKSRFLRTFDNNINYNTMQKMIRKNSNIIVLDVRTHDEFIYKHLQDAINIPLQEVDKRIEGNIKDKNSVIIVYCQSGSRSQKACSKLQNLGYTNVYNLVGGIEAI